MRALTAQRLLLLLLAPLVSAAAFSSLSPTVADARTASLSSAPVSQTPVFTAGESGYAAFRIPGVAASPTVILAVAEGRKFGCPDFGGQHDIVAKRSLDGGATWGALQVVADAASLFSCSAPSGDGECEFWDPTPVFVPATGAFLLLASYCSSSAARLSGLNDLFLFSSPDGGATWSAPRNLSASLGGLPLPTPGNGHGIVLGSGRILVPMYERLPATAAGVQWSPGAYWSDDGGASWQRGALIPNVTFSEPGVAELFAPPGRLLMDTRSDATAQPGCGGGVAHCRVFATSDDAGATFVNVTARGDLPDPGCKGGIARWEAGRGLLAVNDANTTARSNVILRVSVDDGASWPRGVLISEVGGYTDVVTQTRPGASERALVIFEHSACDFIALAVVDPSLI